MLAPTNDIIELVIQDSLLDLVFEGEVALLRDYRDDLRDLVEF